MKKLLLGSLLCCAAHSQAKINLPELQEAARTHKIDFLQRQIEQRRGEALEMYPYYYLVMAQLPTLSEKDASDFLNLYPNTLLADRFRSDWLKELGRRQSWNTFAAEYPKIENPGTDLQCLNAQAQIASGRRDAVLPLRALWFSSNAQPSTCGPVFDALFVMGKLDQDDLWQRIRLALADDNTDLATQLALERGINLNSKLLSKIRTQPEKHHIDNSTRLGRELGLYALNRIARNNIDTAAARLEQLESWPETDRRFAWQQQALLAARKHHPQASAWFAKAGSNGLDADERAWSVRAAIWRSDWKTTIERIDSMPERNDATWRYWRARALREQNRIPEANALFTAIADGHDYYNLLAREELGTIAEPPNIQYHPNEDEVRNISGLAGIQRALALIDSGWRQDAVREWNWAMKGLTDQKLLAAAEFARRQGWYDRAIYSADRTRSLHDFAMRFLSPYREVVEPQARNVGLEPAWVYGVMRQESRFVNTARSGVGAGGLMQLMPATAKWVARKLGWKRFDPSDVNDIATNVTLGTTYLHHIWQQLGSSEVLATAAYNAGPSRARQWQGDEAMDAAIYIENIPFSETRDYVKKVMSNATHYAHTFGTGVVPLKSRIGIIPRQGGAIESP